MKIGKFWCVVIVTAIITLILLKVGRDNSYDLSGARVIGLLAVVGVFYWALVLRLQDAGLSGGLVMVTFVIMLAKRGSLIISENLSEFIGFLLPLTVLVIGLLPSKSKITHAVYKNDDSNENTQ